MPNDGVCTLFWFKPDWSRDEVEDDDDCERDAVEFDEFGPDKLEHVLPMVLLLPEDEPFEVIMRRLAGFGSFKCCCCCCRVAVSNILNIFCFVFVFACRSQADFLALVYIYVDFFYNI